MSRQNLTRWTLTSLLAAAMIFGSVADARPRYVKNAPRSKGARQQLTRATSSYNKARVRYTKYRSLSKRQMKRYAKSGNAAQRQYAQANKFRAVKARVSMMRAQVRGLQAKAKIAVKTGNPDAANRYLDKAAKLSRVANKADNKLQLIAAKQGFATSKRRPSTADLGAATTPATTRKQRTHQDPTRPGATAKKDRAPQALDGENPISDAPKAQRVPGMASYKGKRHAKGQLKSGNLIGAMDTLKRMEAQPNRRGVRGLVDRYRKWSTKRRVLKTSYKVGKRAARAGDMELASEAVTVTTTLRKPGFWTNRKVMAIGNQALKGAKKMAKTQRAEEARMMLDFARNIQMAVGRQRPTLRFRWVRRVASKRVWKDMKARAKVGNMEAFRSAMRLANAYRQENGGKFSKREARQVRKLYMKAMTNSVPRALKDAQLMLSGKMGYVNVEEAAHRYAYAFETSQKLSARGIKIPAKGLFNNIGKEFSKTRGLLVKAMQNQGSMKDNGRPGLAKRIYEKIFVQPHKRTQPQVAPMDSVWMERKARQQQQDMARQAQAQGYAPQGEAGY